MTLKEIAIELLEKYESAETSNIWEYSGNIRSSEDMLKKEIKKYRKMIDEADRKTENSSEKPNNCEDEPQAECEITDCDYHDACKMRGQTDCPWK